MVGSGLSVGLGGIITGGSADGKGNPEGIGLIFGTIKGDTPGLSAGRLKCPGGTKWNGLPQKIISEAKKATK